MSRQWLRAGTWGAAIGLLATAGLAWLATPAKAQRTAVIATCGTLTQATPTLGSAGIIGLDQSGNVCVSASVTASVTGFAPAGTFATLTATGSSASVALPAGAVVVFSNTGTTAVSCTLGVGSATAVASNNVIQAGSWMAMTVGSNTFGACIDQTGSASNVVVLSGGSGLPTGAGGGGSGGGGGAVTIADAADVTQGSTADAACATDNGTCTEIALIKRANQRLTTVNTTLGSPLQAGGSVSVSNANANGSATSANSSPVVIASDQVAVATKAASGAFASGSIASGALASGSVASGAFASGAFASGAFASGSFLNATAADPCMFQNKTNLPISQNGTSSVQLIALSGSTVIYVCSLSIIAAGATTVAFTTGTGSACVTGNAAVIGSTTANIANSMSFVANGGLTLGNGGNTIAKGAAASELCMINGNNVFVSGNLTYVQQ